MMTDDCGHDGVDVEYDNKNDQNDMKCYSNNNSKIKIAKNDSKTCEFLGSWMVSAVTVFILK